MSSTFYDADTAPEPSEWLQIPEQERARLVKNYHVSVNARPSSMTRHCAMHVVIEDMLAKGFAPGKRAIVRFVSAGATRHEAVHALGRVWARFNRELWDGPSPEQLSTYQARMVQAINGLCVDDAGAVKGTRVDG